MVTIKNNADTVGSAILTYKQCGKLIARMDFKTSEGLDFKKGEIIEYTHYENYGDKIYYTITSTLYLSSEVVMELNEYREEQINKLD
jgi:hypothetical protein